MVNEDLAEICLDAEMRHLRRGDMITCNSKHGNDAPENVPVSLLMLEPGEVCVATTLFNSGHYNPDTFNDCQKMYDCPYRRINQSISVESH